MTAAHWLILAAVAVAAWVVLMWRIDAKFAKSIDAEELRSVAGQYPPPDDDDFDAHASEALDVIAEPDRRRAEHMNRTLRRVEGGDEHGTR